MNEKTPRPLALFDFDGTMLAGDSIVSFLRLAHKMRALSTWEYARVIFHTCRYLMGALDEAEAKTLSLRFLFRLPPECSDGLARDFALKVLLPRIYPQARAALERHKKEGKITLLVSASTENYMRYIAQALGFDGLLCTPLAPDGQAGPNCKGEEKVRRMEAWLRAQGIQADFAASYAYGDSKSDLPMLKLVGHPVLVNPKAKLKKALPQAKRVSWTGKEESP